MVLDAIKSIGTGITWCVKRALVAAARSLHWTGVITLVFVIGYLRAGLRTAVIAAAAIFAIGLCGFWDLTMVTLAIMIVAVALAMLIGVPLGIWSGLSDRAERRLRPHPRHGTGDARLRVPDPVRRVLRDRCSRPPSWPR